MGTFLLKNINKFLLIGVFVFLFFLLTPINTLAATLTLTPSTGSYNVGDIFSVQISLNTSGVAINGVDINNLNFNPAVLQVVDSDASLSGAQITPGILIPITSLNTVNNTTGDIAFSQQSNLGQTFTNSSGQTLATVNFRAIALGNANLQFDFVSGVTTDTNVIGVSSGNVTDLLISAQQSSISVNAQTDTTAPVISNVTSLNIGTTGATISWTTNELSTTQVLYGIGNYNSSSALNATLTTSHQVVLASLLSNQTYSYDVVSTDVNGNSGESSFHSFTTLPVPDTISPNTITNLSVSLPSITLNSADLTWTEPSDVPAGPIAGYEMKYSTSPITSNNWATATLLTGLPTANGSGTSDFYRIVGLQSGTKVLRY